MMRHARGFTLFELALILFVLLAVAAVLFPVFATARFGGGPGSSCLSNIKHVGLGLLQYAQDYDGLFPNDSPPRVLPQGRPALSAALIADNRARDWPALAYPYVKNPIIFHCPSEPKDNPCSRHAPPETQAQCVSSYALNGWAAFGLNENAIRSPKRFVLLAERNSVERAMDASYLVSWWNWQQAGNTFTWPPMANPIPTEQAAHDLAITRHGGVSVYAFADGHAKALPFAQAWSAATPTAFWPESQ